MYLRGAKVPAIVRTAGHKGPGKAKDAQHFRRSEGGSVLAIW